MYSLFFNFCEFWNVTEWVWENVFQSFLPMF